MTSTYDLFHTLLRRAAGAVLLQCLFDHMAHPRKPFSAHPTPPPLTGHVCLKTSLVVPPACLAVCTLVTLESFHGQDLPGLVNPIGPSNFISFIPSSESFLTPLIKPNPL